MIHGSDSLLEFAFMIFALSETCHGRNSLFFDARPLEAAIKEQNLASH